jgi:hypothetical protein
LSVPIGCVHENEPAGAVKGGSVDNLNQVAPPDFDERP